MIEVFKTNVTQRDHADRLIDMIHLNFADYRANFDLEDCDHILRVKAISGMVQPSLLIDLLKDFGFQAEILPDHPPVAKTPVHSSSSTNPSNSNSVH